MPSLKFRATIQGETPGKGWAFLAFPPTVSRALGTRARVAVRGTINGFAFRASAMPNGDGSHHIMVNKQMRSGARADVGDLVDVEVEHDGEPRRVTVPPEVKKAIAASQKASAIWKVLTPRCREEWVEWVTSAKKTETRTRRITGLVDRLESGERRVYG